MLFVGSSGDFLLFPTRERKAEGWGRNWGQASKREGRAAEGMGTIIRWRALGSNIGGRQ
jgi:hypothetical protein